MDAEEHRVIMQQVKELEVRGQMASPQYAAARGIPVSGWYWGCVVPPSPCVWDLGHGVPWAVLGELLRSCVLA